MGLSSFPTTVSEGVLPILIVNTALSFAMIKDMLRSLLKIVGFDISSSEPEFMDLSENNSYSSAISAAGGGANPEAQIIAEEIRQNLPIKKFESSDEEMEECAVCLSRFEDGDETRELACCHLFHRPCLDKWLDHQQTTCPLCRSCLISHQTAAKIRLRQQQQQLLLADDDEWIFWCSSSSFQEEGAYQYHYQYHYEGSIFMDR